MQFLTSWKIIVYILFNRLIVRKHSESHFLTLLITPFSFSFVPNLGFDSFISVFIEHMFLQGFKQFRAYAIYAQSVEGFPKYRILRFGNFKRASERASPISFVKLRHSGFNFSIKSIFHLRFQRFKRSSRFTASLMLKKINVVIVIHRYFGLWRFPVIPAKRGQTPGMTSKVRQHERLRAYWIIAAVMHVVQ